MSSKDKNEKMEDAKKNLTTSDQEKFLAYSTVKKIYLRGGCGNVEVFSLSKQDVEINSQSDYKSISSISVFLKEINKESFSPKKIEKEIKILQTILKFFEEKISQMLTETEKIRGFLQHKSGGNEKCISISKDSVSIPLHKNHQINEWRIQTQKKVYQLETEALKNEIDLANKVWEKTEDFSAFISLQQEELDNFLKVIQNNNQEDISKLLGKRNIKTNQEKDDDLINCSEKRVSEICFLGEKIKLIRDEERETKNRRNLFNDELSKLEIEKSKIVRDLLRLKDKKGNFGEKIEKFAEYGKLRARIKDLAGKLEYFVQIPLEESYSDIPAKFLKINEINGFVVLRFRDWLRLPACALEADIFDYYEDRFGEEGMKNWTRYEQGEYKYNPIDKNFIFALTESFFSQSNFSNREKTEKETLIKQLITDDNSSVEIAEELHLNLNNSEIFENSLQEKNERTDRVVAFGFFFFALIPIMWFSTYPKIKKNFSKKAKVNSGEIAKDVKRVDEK